MANAVGTLATVKLVRHVAVADARPAAETFLLTCARLLWQFAPNRRRLPAWIRFALCAVRGHAYTLGFSPCSKRAERAAE
jgi:hypothetical protein